MTPGFLSTLTRSSPGDAGTTTPHVKTTSPVVGTCSPQTAGARLATCHQCPDYRPATDRCGRCGCADTMTRRTTSRLGFCPANRWPDLGNLMG